MIEKLLLSQVRPQPGLKHFVARMLTCSLFVVAYILVLFHVIFISTFTELR